MTAVTDPQALLYEALAKAQSEFPPIPRDKEVTVTPKSGSGSYKFKYAPLDSIFAAVRPVLQANGLAIAQPLTSTEDGRPALRTVLLHSAGGMLEGVLPIKTDGLDPQGLGSLISYVRRYALTSMLGIATEDDDDARSATAKRSAATNGNGKAPKPVVDEIKTLIRDLDAGGVIEEPAVFAGMESTYGTSDLLKLTSAQATNLRDRLKAKALA